MAELVDLPSVRVRRAPPERLHVLHCAPEDAPALAVNLGVDLPEEMLRGTAEPGPRALHLAPDEWLLIGWTGPHDMRDDVPAHSLVEVSSRGLTLEIEGPSAELLLNSGCPLDLAAFKPGDCTRTLLGKVQIMLGRRQHCFRMQYGRSFDHYVTEWLQTAAKNLPAPGPA